MKKLFTILVMFIAMNVSAQWVQISNGITSGTTIQSLAAIGNNLIAGAGYEQGLYFSTNNGLNWSHNNYFLDHIVYSLLTVGNTVFAGVYNQFHAPPPNGVYISTNYGSNWNSSLPNWNSFLSLASNNNYVFAGGWGGVWYTLNNGANWYQTSLSGITIYSLTTNGNNIYAGSDGNGVYLSTNNGLNWVQTTLTNQKVYSIAVFDNNIFAGTAGYLTENGIFLSTNNGNTWTQTIINNIPVYSLTRYGNNIFAGTNSGIYLSTNIGLNWNQINEGFNGIPNIQSLLIANGFIYVGTYQNAVYRRPLSDVIGIQNISTEIPSSYSLGQNYPNPFNPMCNVQFTMCNAGKVKIVVYDVQGREVQTLVDERLNAGTYEMKFDGSMLTSGVYFYRMVTEGFSETRKMLLIK